MQFLKAFQSVDVLTMAQSDLQDVKLAWLHSLIVLFDSEIR